MRARSDLNNVFANTDYCVEHPDETVTLHLNQPTPKVLAEWIAAHNGPAPAWLITAYNPGGEAAPGADNRARHARLDTLLARHGLRRLAAVNRDRSGDWPDEPGWLVAGLEEGMARSLAQRFGQAAIVAVDRHRVGLLWI